MNHLAPALFLGLIGALFIWVAARFHYFRVKTLPLEPKEIKYPLLGILGYLLLFLIVAPYSIRLLGRHLQNFSEHSPALLMTLLQVISLCWVIAYLFVFSLLQSRKTLQIIWMHPMRTRLSCAIEDFGLGVLTWLIAFPVVGAVSQVMEFLTVALSGRPLVDQLAVRYLKMAKESPPLFAIALFAILIAAPVIEEFVFRGILFSYFRKKFSMVKSAVFSAIIFSLFHFSPEQGASNVSLLCSLFSLALFLGFLFERQRSLIAPIALHMTFNSISVIRILLISN